MMTPSKINSTTKSPGHPQGLIYLFTKFTVDIFMKIYYKIYYLYCRQNSIYKGEVIMACKYQYLNYTRDFLPSIYYYCQAADSALENPEEDCEKCPYILEEERGFCKYLEECEGPFLSNTLFTRYCKKRQCKIRLEECLTCPDHTE